MKKEISDKIKLATNASTKMCISCGKILNNKSKKCKCGCSTFVLGNNVSLNKSNIVCGCGNKEFSSSLFLDFTDKSVASYSCNNCNAVISIESYESYDEK